MAIRYIGAFKVKVDGHVSNFATKKERDLFVRDNLQDGKTILITANSTHNNCPVIAWVGGVVKSNQLRFDEIREVKADNEIAQEVNLYYAKLQQRNER